MIHPTAIIHDNVRIGKGVFIGPYCVIGLSIREFNAGVEIEDNVIIEAHSVVVQGENIPTVIMENTYVGCFCLINHDVIIGQDCEIFHYASVHGCCKVASGARLGIGSRLRPGKKMHKGAYLGMGAIAVNDIPQGEVWVGVPARKMRQRDSGLGWFRIGQWVKHPLRTIGRIYDRLL